MEEIINQLALQPDTCGFQIAVPGVTFLQEYKTKRSENKRGGMGQDDGRMRAGWAASEPYEGLRFHERDVFHA